MHFELRPRATATTLILDHTGFPEGDYDHLSAGWHAHYWDRMTKWLAD